MPWLLKTEPETYSIDDLAIDKRTWWEGVRNYQARNFMRDSMRVGERVLVHHSSADPPAIVGIARVSSQAQPDLTAQDPKSPYFDASASASNPIWMAIEIEFVEKFRQPVELARLRATPELGSMPLLRPGQRLSVQPVAEKEFAIVERLAREVEGKLAAPAKTAKLATKPKAKRKPGSAARGKATAAGKRR